MMRVLRLCSVFEPRSLTPGSAAYDPIGGMQNHVAELTRCLDRLGVAQLVVTSRLAGPADHARFGVRGQVVRTGLPVPVLRQGWAPLAMRHALAGGGRDLVHVHCGEDLAVLPLARLAARRHHCPLVATIHLSVRHALRPVTARGAVLQAAGGAVERWLLPRADAVIALTPSTAQLLRSGGIPAGRCESSRPAMTRPCSPRQPMTRFPACLGRGWPTWGGWCRRRTSARCWPRSPGCRRAPRRH
jgi:2-deoxystreptamine N-acetyl-D-glucosaminyltransferase/2-deoxystreptamine glucosyltransferase